jgi:multisubunit Na+/H+ antiporter MnhE subunit
LLGINVEGLLQDAYLLIINFMNVRLARLHDFAAVQLISSLFWNLARSHVANLRRTRSYKKEELNVIFPCKDNIHLDTQEFQFGILRTITPKWTPS